jgi:hypothetical protein
MGVDVRKQLPSHHHSPLQTSFNHWIWKTFYLLLLVVLLADILDGYNPSMTRVKMECMLGISFW